MRKYIFSFLLLIFISKKLSALTPEEIIKKVDDNQVFKSIKYSGIMTIQKGNRRQPRVKEFKAVALGKNRAYIEFTNPGDRGTKYLKLGDELWIKGVYAEEPEKISGHLLRESMMGSDYSYEDTMDNESLLDQYDIKLLGQENLENNGECYKLELTAKVKKITYYRKIIWVDTKRFVAMKVQFFALSGKLLKEMNIIETRELSGRFFPVKVKMENKQRHNSYTIFEMKKLELDIPVDDSLFSKQQLEK